VRATSLPPALPVAAAAIPLMAAVLVPLAVPSAALAERWLRPVPGEVARPFSYTRASPFARGAHRGADLAARPGTPIRSACSGAVVHAGPVAGHGRVVSVRCGARRVSYLPLATSAVRAGTQVRAGTPIGTVGTGHGGLHVGVRREADRFGYEDPLALLSARRRPPGPVPIAAPRRPPRAVPRPVAAPRPPLPRALARRPATQPRAARRHVSPRAVAPWPVWTGLALLLAGAAGSGSVALRRRRRAASRSRSGASALPDPGTAA
jgi:murein DD-endopeptidase MepM/ murein hydrolase activator NlpD